MKNEGIIFVASVVKNFDLYRALWVFFFFFEAITEKVKLDKFELEINVLTHYFS